MANCTSFFGGISWRALIIVHEDEPALSIQNRALQRNVSKIILPCGRCSGIVAGISASVAPHSCRKKMEPPQEVVLFADLPVLAEWRLKIIIFHRHVIPVTGGLGFHQGAEFALGTSHRHDTYNNRATCCRSQA